MPRKMRVQYPGAMYHVMSRGDQRDDIFLNEVDRYDFIKTLGEACLKTDWQVHAFCLMKNHYHLVIETPNANLVAGMAWLQSAYTIRLNHRHKLTGHVLSGRYKAQIVEGSGNGYLRTACDYVHLNPVRAALLAPEDRLLAYPWSSFGLYLAAPEHRPAWLRVDRLLGEHGLNQDTPVSRREFERHMERRRLEEMDPEALEAFGRDWCLGSDAFRKEQLERMEGGLGEHHAGELGLESAQARADRFIAEELRRLGWSMEDLVRRPKNDPGKLAIAVRLRRETSLTIKAITARLDMGTYNTANARLHRAMKEGFGSSDNAQATTGK
ncbi:MAG: transposase [Limisphaerales bacterium]